MFVAVLGPEKPRRRPRGGAPVPVGSALGFDNGKCASSLGGAMEMLEAAENVDATGFDDLSTAQGARSASSSPRSMAPTSHLDRFPSAVWPFRTRCRAPTTTCSNSCDIFLRGEVAERSSSSRCSTTVVAKTGKVDADLAMRRRCATGYRPRRHEHRPRAPRLPLPNSTTCARRRCSQTPGYARRAWATTKQKFGDALRDVCLSSGEPATTRRSSLRGRPQLLLGVVAPRGS